MIFKKDLDIDAYVISDIGTMCSKNEDNYLLAYSLTPDLKLLLAVADGVRDNSVPDVASKLAIDKLKEYHINKEAIFGKNAKINYRSFIVNAVQEINSYFLSISERVKSYSNMASTLTSISITKKNKFFGFSVGDSCIFLFRNGKLRKICGSEEISLSKEPSKNVLGVSDNLIFESKEFKVRRGDKFIILTDGALKYPSFFEKATKTLKENSNPVNICNILVREALYNKVNDNITIGVVIIK